jgi:hypothetical protein
MKCRNALRTWQTLPLVALLLVSTPKFGVAAVSADAPAATGWKNGPDTDPHFFPIAVWLQDPKNAARYRELGINTYVALWQGPTQSQIDLLKQHGMKLICEQSDKSLKFIDEKLLIAWMHGDEPDNAQSLGDGKGYGPPVPAENIVADYRRIRQRDPSRPVILNLGQGVAWDGWYGRGMRTNHPEDYAKYLDGCDIASFDIYPAVHFRPEIAGKLWYVAHGVNRLVKWTNHKKPIWNCIECTRISNPDVKPTPEQVKAEVWMAIIHGSRGLIYFCHQFEPKFIEAGLLADEDMSRAVKAVNAQVLELAPVINSDPVGQPVEIHCEPPKASDQLEKTLGGLPVALMARRHGGACYLFTVAMEDRAARAEFTIPGLKGEHPVEVIGEGRSITSKDGRFSDDYSPCAVHLYRVRDR